MNMYKKLSLYLWWWLYGWLVIPPSKPSSLAHFFLLSRLSNFSGKVNNKITHTHA